MLQEIASKYRTDKFTCHSYIDAYSDLLTGREDSINNVLEIGIQFGYSLEVWDELFPNAKIYGVDIENQLPSDFNVTDKMDIIIGNAYTESFIKNNFMLKQFDLIIDDGSHVFEDMAFVAKYYSSLLSSNGILIIEDISSIEYAENLLNFIPLNARRFAYIIDNSKITGRWDDILLVINRKNP